MGLASRFVQKYYGYIAVINKRIFDMETAIKLSAVENIAELAKESQLSPEFYRKASRFIKHLSDKHLNGE